MKNKSVAFAREEARIYKNYYRPSLNVFRFIKSILVVLLTGSSNAIHHQQYGRK